MSLETQVRTAQTARAANDGSVSSGSDKGSRHGPDGSPTASHFCPGLAVTSGVQVSAMQLGYPGAVIPQPPMAGRVGSGCHDLYLSVHQTDSPAGHLQRGGGVRRPPADPLQPRLWGVLSQSPPGIGNSEAQ